MSASAASRGALSSEHAAFTAAAAVRLLTPGLLVVGWILFSSSGRDDGHLTYWAAQSLARFGRILNYNGVPVEQSSSLLHVLIIALVQKVIGLDAVTIGRMTTIVGGAIAVVVTHVFASSIDQRAGWPAAALTALAPYFAYWSFGGLEATLMAATATLCILTCCRYLETGTAGRASAMVIATALFVLTRPESPMVIVCVGLVLIAVLSVAASAAHVNQGQALLVMRRRAVDFLGTAAVLSVGQFVYRLVQFDRLFPQPVTAKSRLVPHLRAGLDYFGGQIFDQNVATAAIFVACAVATVYVLIADVRQRRVDVYVVMAAAFLMSYTAFILCSGGDWMEGGRFLVPMIPVLMTFGAVAVRRALSSQALQSVTLALALVISAAGCIEFATDSSIGMPLWATLVNARPVTAEPYSWFELHNRVNLRDIPTIDSLNGVVQRLADRQAGPVRIMSGQMGMVAFHIASRWFGRVQWLDLHGLADRTLTDCPSTATLPRRRLGMDMGYRFYFAHQSDCGLTSPDVIFDIEKHNIGVVEANGFVVVYRQEGTLDVTSRIHGGVVPNFQFIAVRKDLLSAAQHDE